MDNTNYRQLDDQIISSLFNINFKDALLEGNSNEDILKKDYTYTLTVVFNDNLIYEIKNQGVQTFVLDTIVSYGDMRTIKWLREYHTTDNSITWFETIEFINKENPYKTLEILRVMRNLYDKEIFENKIIKKSEYLERQNITKDLFDVCLYESLMK